MDNKFLECIAQHKPSSAQDMKYKYSRQRDPILWTKSPIIQKWVNDDFRR